MQDFTITPSTLFGPTGSDVSASVTYFDFTVDQFDPSLGVLDSIEFSLNADFTLSGVTGPDGIGSIGGSVGGTIFANSVDFEGNGGGGGFGDDPNTNLNIPIPVNNLGFETISVSSSSPDFLAAVTGNGTFSLSWSGDASLTASGLGTDTGQLDLTGGTVSWTYNFTTVPEPSSIALLALGSMAIFTRKRR